jgi:CheY-like chemotaxis protein
MATSLLLIDPDARRRAALATALTAVGHEVVVAASGGFALTMLERRRPDVILCRYQIEDMYAHEFCAIVRADPHTRDIPFILLTDRVPCDPEAVGRAVTDAARIAGPGPAAVAPPRPLRPAKPVLAPAQPVLHGTEMYPIVRAVCDGRKTGRLRARLGTTEGALLFEGGKLVHAEFAGQEGKPAITGLLAAAQASRGGIFNFVPWDGAEVPRRARSSDRAEEDLLLQAWASLEASRPPEPPGGTGG